MKKEFYLITVGITPYLCTTIITTCVISECPIDLLLRQKIEDTKFNLMVMHNIDEEKYNKFKKRNPTNDHYLKMKKEDYSKFFK